LGTHLHSRWFIFIANTTKNFPLHIYAVGNSFAIPSYFSNLHEEI
jgi:hypothetical protein